MIRRGVGRDRPGVMGSVSRTAVMASAASAVAQAEHTARAEALRREQVSRRDAPARGPAPAAVDKAEQLVAVLKDLAALHQQGILTDRELAEQKAHLLG